MDRYHNVLMNLYTSPESYILERVVNREEVCSYSLRGEDVEIYRDQDHLEVLFKEHVSSTPLNAINLVIAMNRDLYETYVTLSMNILRLRSPLLTPYDMCRMRCTKQGERAQPLLIDVAVQRLPMGELLSTALEDASFSTMEKIYSSIANLEQALRDGGLEFERLRAEDVILGKDKQLYPFRYDTLHFDRTRPSDERVAECDMLRSDVARISGRDMWLNHYFPGVNPYRTTLCDIDGGHISCRAPHEGLIAIEDAEGWGFVDIYNRVVIEPKYMSVSDFKLGMAVVQLFETECYGVIDSSGEYIAEPIYGTIRIDDNGDIFHGESF